MTNEQARVILNALQRLPDEKIQEAGDFIQVLKDGHGRLDVQTTWRISENPSA